MSSSNNNDEDNNNNSSNYTKQPEVEKSISTQGNVLATPEKQIRKRRYSGNASETTAAADAADAVASPPVLPKEKSTVTTLTASAATENAYDSVLAESADLWQAASEAQQLGRLKMASSYLLLLHARLVGLGKRFDKAERPTQQNMMKTPVKKARKTGRKGATKTDTNEINNSLLTPNTAKVLSDLLPDDIEMDQAMMEHLAKAAAELHAARTGKRRHTTTWNNGLIGYDYSDTLPQQRRGPTSDWEWQQMQMAQQQVANDSLVWSLGEIRVLQKALAEAEENNTAANPEALAQQLGRNPAQVRAFLRNQNTKSRIAADLALESGHTSNSSRPDRDETDNNNDNTPNRRRGGRGPKPPTTALQTVPHADCDARALLQGDFLPAHEDPAQWNVAEDDDDKKKKPADETKAVSG